MNWNCRGELLHECTNEYCVKYEKCLLASVRPVLPDPIIPKPKKYVPPPLTAAQKRNKPVFTIRVDSKRPQSGLTPKQVKRKKVLSTAPVCWLCGVKITHKIEETIDHVIPKHLGGSNRRTNLRPAHYLCNQIKGHLMPDSDEFKELFPRAKTHL